jgi:perosamine synthetase
MIPIAKPIITKKEKNAVSRVLDSGMLAMGEEVKKLENEFSSMFGYRHAIATSSGTTALQVALYAHDIHEGDEVITTPFTFIATANSILSAGAKPIFVDIDPRTLNINPDLIEEKITKKTKAILPVHLYGQPCNMTKISLIAKKHKLIIIEDACQAHGAKWKKKYVGSWGTTTFSLYPTKNITSGEGGLLTTNNARIAQKVRLLINHGQEIRYKHIEFGLNYRMTNIHAAIGRVQLKKLTLFTKKRQQNAKYFLKHINPKYLLTPKKDVEHVYHQFTLRILKNRDRINQELHKKGIGTGIHYPTPIHKQPFYKKLGYGKTNLPVAEKAAKQVLSIPVHPSLTQQEKEYIVKTVNSLLQKHS